MKVISAIAVISTAFFVAWTRHRLNLWEHAVDEFENVLRTDDPISLPVQQSWDDLPPIVQRFLNQVVPPVDEDDTTTVDIALLNAQQEGEFRLKGDSWVPFSANQVTSTNPPGFVWNACISLQAFAKWPSVQVCDAWARGNAMMKAALVNVWDLPQPPNNSDLLLGEALRWLAEAPMVPTVLLPEHGMVTWTAIEGEENKALLAMTQGPKDSKLEVTFSNAGWLIRVDGIRPFWTGEDFSLRRWQGRFGQYVKQAEGFLVPTKMECGWVQEDGIVELYFRAENKILEYAMRQRNNGEKIQNSEEEVEVPVSDH